MTLKSIWRERSNTSFKEPRIFVPPTFGADALRRITWGDRVVVAFYCEIEKDGEIELKQYKNGYGVITVSTLYITNWQLKYINKQPMLHVGSAIPGLHLIISTNHFQNVPSIDQKVWVQHTRFEEIHVP